MRTAPALVALVVGSALASHARADAVFRDPNLHCPRGAVVQPTHGPSYCMVLPCTSASDCPAYQFDGEHAGDCVPTAVCVLSETLSSGWRAPPGSTWVRESAVAECDTAPCAQGECRRGNFCVAHTDTPPPPLGVPPSIPAPPSAGVGNPIVLTSVSSGLCGGACAGAIVSLAIGLFFARRKR